MSKNKSNVTDQTQRDPDLINAEVAMKRADIKARKLVQMSGTAVVAMKNGVINEENPGHTKSST